MWDKDMTKKKQSHELACFKRSLSYLFNTCSQPAMASACTSISMMDDVRWLVEANWMANPNHSGICSLHRIIRCRYYNSISERLQLRPWFQGSWFSRWRVHADYPKPLGSRHRILCPLSRPQMPKSADFNKDPGPCNVRSLHATEPMNQTSLGSLR